MLRPGRPARSLREHELIFGAIVAHDPEAADSAMRDHLEEVIETLRWAIDHKSRPSQWLPD
jgi:DNA-binding FadR family transcriptional regulator